MKQLLFLLFILGFGACGIDPPKSPAILKETKITTGGPGSTDTVLVHLRKDGATLIIPEPYELLFYQFSPWVPPTINLEFTFWPGFGSTINFDCTSCDEGNPNVVIIANGIMQEPFGPQGRVLDFTWIVSGHGKLVLFDSTNFGGCISNPPNHLLVRDKNTGLKEFWYICGERITEDNVWHENEIIYRNHPLIVPQIPTSNNCKKNKCQISE